MDTYYRRDAAGELEELTAEEAAPYIAGAKRVSMVNGQLVIFTEAEELARDAEEAEWQVRAAEQEQERQTKELRAAALSELEDKLLADAAASPVASQAIRDYAAAARRAR